MRTIQKRTIVIAPVALVLLASCGGGGDSSDQNAAVTEKAVPTTTATTTPGSAGAKQKSSAAGEARKKAQAKKAEPKPRTNAGIEALKRQARELKQKTAKIKKRGKKNGGNSSPTTITPSKPLPAPQPGGTPQQILGNKAKRVCHNLGLPALAKRFDVAATTEAVATAYAQTYPETLKAAVHDGCLSGLIQQ
jgi:hypothetical protein